MGKVEIEWKKAVFFQFSVFEIRCLILSVIPAEVAKARIREKYKGGFETRPLDYDFGHIGHVHTDS